MSNLNKKLFLWLLLGISVLIWIGLAGVRSIAWTDLVRLLKLFPTVVAIDCLMVGLFVKWFWKWHLLYPWLVPFPNLNGTWTGEIRSSYKDAMTQQKLAVVAATLSVRQTFADISCVMETAEMRSASALCGFDLNPDKQQRQLAYIYCSRPKLSVSDRSPMHDGAVVFDVIGEPPTKLSGRYWTTRGTSGDVELTRQS
jgi:hypothetical protein